MPKFLFVSERTFEPWDWTNPTTQGIGGSETSHIELAQRLSRRGHEVVSFAPLANETPGAASRLDPAGVWWLPTEHFAGCECDDGPLVLHQADMFVIYRAPRLIDELPEGSIAWLICQDVDYTRPDNFLSEARALRFTRIVALCHAQADYLRRRLPAAADRVVVSSNGIRSDVIRSMWLDSPARNPLRMMYASSPDRGLEFLLPIYERVKEIVPAAELHVCYGFDNIDKVIAHSRAGAVISENKQRLLSEMERLGVVHHGRMGQTELLREWFKSAVWCHPSNFTETSCITCMDAQACGVVPVTSPVWAIAENVQHGVFIEGDVRGDLVRARYVREVAELLLNPNMQDEHREQMFPWALERFDWERICDQWAGWAAVDLARPPAVSVEEIAEYPGVSVEQLAETAVPA